MWLTERATPVATTHGNDRDLRHNHGATDGRGHFLGALDTQTEMAVRVTNGHKGLETSALTGTRLLLHRCDLHHLVGELRQQDIHHLVLLNGEREQVDLFHRLDLAILHETTKRRHRHCNTVSTSDSSFVKAQ